MASYRQTWLKVCGVCVGVVLLLLGAERLAPTAFGGHPSPNPDSHLSAPVSGWVQVSAGNYHSCGIRADGSAWCWGSNSDGQLGDGSRTSSTVPVRVASVPSYDEATGLGSDSTWSQISAGGDATCAVRDDDTAWCWGENGHAQASEGSRDRFLNPHQVTRDGSAVHLSTVDTTGGTSCGLALEVYASCWGWSNMGQGPGGTKGAYPRRPPTVGSVTQVSSNGQHTCAVTVTGNLWCWGSAGYGETGTGDAGTNNFTPRQSGTDADWRAVSSGFQFSCGLRASGTLWCWGQNQHGQLGIGAPTVRLAPVRVGTSSSWAAVESGTSHSCGITHPGRLWCWGDNTYGQVTGSSAYHASPLRVGTRTDWAQVSSGTRHSCAVTTTGVAWCWGSNSNGQLGDRATTTSRHPVEVHSPR